MTRIHIYIIDWLIDWSSVPIQANLSHHTGKEKIWRNIDDYSINFRNVWLCFNNCLDDSVMTDYIYLTNDNYWNSWVLLNSIHSPHILALKPLVIIMPLLWTVKSKTCLVSDNIAIYFLRGKFLNVHNIMKGSQCEFKCNCLRLMQLQMRLII